MRHPSPPAATGAAQRRVRGAPECRERRPTGRRRARGPLAGLALIGALALGGCNSSQVWFSNDGNLTDVLSSEMEGASDTLDIAVYTFTSEPICDAIIDASARGVKVRVAIDTWATNDAVAKALADDGVNVRRVEGYNGGIMHHKFIVVDEARVLTGSFNFTRAADEANDENIVMIANKVVAGQYTSAFGEVWSRGEDE
jgi:phosphatidylserine/phosphatidylglycerophosphate/cardiolipin synthase-like enzyme